MSRVTVRLPDQLHQRLHRQGSRRGASLNEIIVAILSEAVDRMDEVAEEVSNLLEEQVKQVRAALGPLALELDIPPDLRPSAGQSDVTAYRRSLPRLNPPLSATIIADRDDRA